MTPIQLQDTILHAVGEPEAIFHPRDLVRFYVQHAEQLLSMTRAITESTASLSLTYGQHIYELHPLLTGFIYPLHVAINKRQLFPTTLSRIVDKDREWTRSIEMPREFFMVNGTHIGFYPAPPASGLVARITYVTLPEVVQDTQTYMSGPEWHELLGEYVAAILLAKEQKYDVAQMKLQAFSEGIGMPREVRFAAQATKGEVTNQPIHPPTEIHEG